MNTVWTGHEFIMQFKNRDVTLSMDETKEFEEWFQSHSIDVEWTKNGMLNNNKK